MANSDGPGARIAYLGPPSSYTHQAALETFDKETDSFEPQSSIKDVFIAVQSSVTPYGVVPFENSTNGSVVYTLDLLVDRQNEYFDIHICGEAYLDVHHYLLGHAVFPSSTGQASSGHATPTSSVPYPVKPKSQPLTSLQHITRIYSHPQAFGQCEAFLTTYLKGIERQEVSSTSKAGELVAKDSTKNTAAISSRTAAEVHHLDVLAKGIQDREDNKTRFFIIGKGPTGKPWTISDALSQNSGDAKWKTLVAFNVNHQTRGALADALMVFKTHNLNLTSINSRPSRIKPWHYIFLVEFEGKKEENGTGKVNEALEELDKLTLGWNWLGSWINAVDD